MRCRTSLAEAVDAMERSTLVAEALGDHVFEYFIRNKRTEWNEYTVQVTPWEMDRYSRMASEAWIEPLLVFPNPPPPILAQTLDLAGFPWKAVANASIAMQKSRATDGAARSLSPTTIPKAPSVSAARCQGDSPLERVLLLITGAQLAELELREDLFDDFCLAPFHPRELDARLRHLQFRAGRGSNPEMAAYGDLLLNFETYQAIIGDRPLDLTYMEYELLKFFVHRPRQSVHA